MFRRLRSLYSGVRLFRVDDEASLKYYGSLAQRDAVREQTRQEVNSALTRMPLR